MIQNFKEAIEKGVTYAHSGLYQVDFNTAASSCEAIAEEEIKSLIEWMEQTVTIIRGNGKWKFVNRENASIVSPAELFILYKNRKQ